jgi:pimeloyl-ACP methyl ester carboxylesterase
VKVPATRYAKAPDGTSIAFQTVGDGSIDLVYATGIWSNLEVMWEDPTWARFLDRLARFSRLILFDMRGVGLSDRGPEPPSLELQRDDVGAVMDEAGSDQAIVFGGARAASMAMLFAATHPDRTKALVLYAPVAKTVSAPGYPEGLSVSIGARVAAHAEPSEVLVSQTVKDLVAGSGLSFEDAGEHQLKGVPDRWRLYRVVG